MESGQVPADAAAAARAEPLQLRPSETPNDCTGVPEAHNDWGFFCDWFTRWWSSQSAFGATADERQRTLRRGGFSIVSSLDPGVQRATTEQVAEDLPADGRRGGADRGGAAGHRAGAGDVGEPRTTASRTTRSGRRTARTRSTSWSPAAAAIEGYQGGSTFKLFTMLAALESGLPLSTDFVAPTQLLTRFPVDRGGELRRPLVPGERQPRRRWTAPAPCGARSAAR